MPVFSASVYTGIARGRLVTPPRHSPGAPGAAARTYGGRGERPNRRPSPPPPAGRDPLRPGGVFPWIPSGMQYSTERDQFCPVRRWAVNPLRGGGGLPLHTAARCLVGSSLRGPCLPRVGLCDGRSPGTTLLRRSGGAAGAQCWGRAQGGMLMGCWKGGGYILGSFVPPPLFSKGRTHHLCCPLAVPRVPRRRRSPLPAPRAHRPPGRRPGSPRPGGGVRRRLAGPHGVAPGPPDAVRPRLTPGKGVAGSCSDGLTGLGEQSGRQAGHQRPRPMAPCPGDPMPRTIAGGWGGGPGCGGTDSPWPLVAWPQVPPQLPHRPYPADGLPREAIPSPGAAGGSGYGPHAPAHIRVCHSPPPPPLRCPCAAETPPQTRLPIGCH